MRRPVGGRSARPGGKRRGQNDVQVSRDPGPFANELPGYRPLADESLRAMRAAAVSGDISQVQDPRMRSPANVH